MISTTDKTVGEIAAANPSAARVFEKHGIDYCCGGGRPFELACREKGLSDQQILAEVEQTKPTGDVRDWVTAPLAELADHIVNIHHAYLRSAMPALDQRLAKVIAAHGPNHGDSLLPLRQAWRGLVEELTAHMMKEEMILFPLIKRIEAGAGASGAHCGSVNNPIRVMEYEHDSAANALREMRRVTGDYALPADACNTYRALFEGFQELETDLHLHIHLENNILFPRASELEARLSNG